MGIFNKNSKPRAATEANGPNHPQQSTTNVSDAYDTALEDETYDLSPTSSVAQSVALSEAETLLQDKPKHTELQESFDANLTHYYPFVLRKARLEAQKETIKQMLAKQGVPQEEDDDASGSDDAATILNDDHVLEGIQIMNKPTSVFNAKRELVIVQELLKNNCYVFTSETSFEKFKDLRRTKKLGKDQSIICDSNNKYRRVANSELAKLSGYTMDSRTHIIPPESKELGIGLPLFKIQVPYLNFRKNAPHMTFRRYREVPLRPLDVEANVSENEEDYETYPFCMVYSKFVHHVRRFLFLFCDEQGQTKFKIVLFLNLEKPFSDFNYKGTRFRVTGTSVLAGFNATRPSFKLLILDDDMPSLCDNIEDGKPGFEILKIIKRKGSTDGEQPAKEPQAVEVEDPTQFINPIPSPTNPLITDERSGISFHGLAKHISNNLPPFGTFSESSLSRASKIIPKKFSDAGKIELYQDFANHTDKDSTLLVDEDTLVLSCIISTLWEYP
ncbi:uncharacterized protein CANTADRAFT_4433 [Suhomyces tanzawaensis NRRL Y-17324]|uniref:Uncharacterized protein n=1 Tax=Suhomyces tanzawaensis NRRL Y-17324 TaxID=984487 RepID=A0A1E4SSG3_9ASCO|nr:uncharacterized protein CANTADRAFT_4433 [Suhomyces tanzawaensis NRRL Y-17324]ODV82441.1 hypothetical protein CANTADRAFT_4433 [Suhomyces tanzawaensis NRRL Y-17324]